MTVYGKFIDREVTIEDREDGLNVISHKTLEKLADEFDVWYTLEFVSYAGGSYIFKCSASCDKLGGRRAEAIGESSLRNLATDISKKYPAIMASKRAFDRAMIRIFGFEEGYSDCEIEKEKREILSDINSNKTASVEAPAAISETEPDVIAEAAPEAEPDIKTEPDVVPTEIATPETAPDAFPEEPVVFEAEESTESEEVAEDIFATPFEEAETEINPFETEEAESVVTGEDISLDALDSGRPAFLDIKVKVGSCKHKGWTMEELFKNAPENLKWIAYTNCIDSEPYVSQREAARKTFEYFEGKEA